MTGVVKTDYSPKKGKENKNISNHIPVLATARKNAKNEAKCQMTPKKEKAECTKVENEKSSNEKSEKVDKNQNESKDDTKEEENSSSSTSNRSIRPQTKILRRPTPNLKHPVIQVDSDDSCGDSSSSDKSKDDNPKRLKMGSDSNPDSSHKRKNFIMYNKYNVDKNTKNNQKERTSATLPASIPNPCNSCNRSQAPERLHSHARKDARGLMLRRSPALDVKMSSPQKKVTDSIVKVKKDAKSSLTAERTREETQISNSAGTTSADRTESKESRSDTCQSDGEPQIPLEDLLEPLKACYICQKEFKISLLLLHESKCLETWKKTNNSLNPNLRQLPPRRPEENLPLVVSSPIIATDVDDPAWSTVQSQLIPCPLCGRTFFPERLPVHRRVCKGKQSPRPLKRASSLREQSASSTEEEANQTPLYLSCYVCSRNYGSWVLPMHEQQCLRKWRKENDKLSDEDRQEEPRKNTDYGTDDDVASLIELGDNAWESHLQQLVPCPRCSRTFFPDRLEIHERSCKGTFGNRRPRSNKGI